MIASIEKRKVAEAERLSARVAARSGWRTPKAVVVDGIRYESISAAARAIGCATSNLCGKLKTGAGMYKGHNVSYAEVM